MTRVPAHPELTTEIARSASHLSSPRRSRQLLSHRFKNSRSLWICNSRDSISVLSMTSTRRSPFARVVNFHGLRSVTSCLIGARIWRQISEAQSSSSSTVARSTNVTQHRAPPPTKPKYLIGSIGGTEVGPKIFEADHYVDVNAEWQSDDKGLLLHGVSAKARKET